MGRRRGGEKSTRKTLVEAFTPYFETYVYDLVEI